MYNSDYIVKMTSVEGWEVDKNNNSQKIICLTPNNIQLRKNTWNLHKAL